MLSSRRRRRSKSKTKTFFAWLCCSEIHNIQKASLFRIIFHVMRVFLRSQGLSINCSVNKLKKSVRCVCPSTVVDLRNYAKTWQADRQVICNSIRDLHKKIPPPGRSSATHSLPDWLTLLTIFSIVYGNAPTTVCPSWLTAADGEREMRARVRLDSSSSSIQLSRSF